MMAVIVLGFHLVPAPPPVPPPVPPQHFNVTVFLHGKAGRQVVVLRNHGKVSLDLGADKRIEAVDDKGEARFAGIPGDLRDREVALGLDDDIYELVNRADHSPRPGSDLCRHPAQAAAAELPGPG